jgi:hypothetical protein
MTILHVLVEELLQQGPGGAGDRYLRAFLSLARGCPWLGPVMPGPNDASS